MHDPSSRQESPSYDPPSYDPLFAVDEKVVVLTGATGLIGRTLARALAERGARLVLVDVSNDALDTLCADLPGEPWGVECDISESAAVAALTEGAMERHGRIDVLINAHQYKIMEVLRTPAEEFPEDLWDRMVDVNLKGTFLTCRDIGRRMLERGRGSIVNFASTYAVVSSNPALYEANSMGNPVSYSASKGGVIMLTRYLAAQWSGRGVRVNAVTPHGVLDKHEQGFIDRFSAMSPMGRMMHADEVVGAVLFLASDASSYATGSNLMVDGGWSVW